MYAQTRAQRGLILGALRCALIVGHSAGSVWERVAMATHSFAFTLFTRAICCQVAGVTSPCLANVSIKSTRACLKAGLFMYGALVDTMGVVGGVGRVILKRINKSTWWTFLVALSVSEGRASAK